MSFSTTSSTSSKDNTDTELYIDKDIVLFLNKQLGKGGFGQIYKGEHIKSHTPLGIKDFQNNFHRESISKTEEKKRKKDIKKGVNK